MHVSFLLKSWPGTHLTKQILTLLCCALLCCAQPCNVNKNFRYQASYFCIDPVHILAKFRLSGSHECNTQWRFKGTVHFTRPRSTTAQLKALATILTKKKRVSSHNGTMSFLLCRRLVFSVSSKFLIKTYQHMDLT